MIRKIFIDTNVLVNAYTHSFTKNKESKKNLDYLYQPQKP
jgi:predicted nucleic acid-binding protein